MGSMDRKPDGVDADLATEDHQQNSSWADGRAIRRSAGPPASSMNRHRWTRSPAWAVALLTSLALTGCQTVMTNPAHTPEPSDSVTPASGKGSSDVLADWPLRFFAHDFDASCYSTYGCKVKYGNYRRIDNEDELKLSSASIGDKYPNNLSGNYGPIRNFPPPAFVTWRSKDGTPLRAEIDIAEIFKDQLILHNLKREEISTKGSVPLPQIILEVNDRTINVYMRATIWTKEEQIPGNKYSRARNDLIKAFSRTY